MEDRQKLEIPYIAASEKNKKKKIIRKKKRNKKCSILAQQMRKRINKSEKQTNIEEELQRKDMKKE